MEFENRVVVVTGAASGIGQACAKAFGALGAAVVAADLNQEGAAETASGLDRALALGIDVSKPEDAQRMVAEAMAAFGRIDVLINSAGISARAAFLDTTPEQFERVIRVNLTGTFFCGQAAAAEMVKAGSGRIVNIASISGQRAGWGRTAYGSSKGGVIQLTRQMAVELGPLGVNVNALAPGPVETPLVVANHTAETREAYGRAIPLARYGQPEEMANAALFLASARADYINGHVLNVDGGYRATGINA